MTTGKTSTLTFRIEPALKDALRAAAEKEHRSIANMVAVMIRDYCGRHGVTIQDGGTTPTLDQLKPRRARAKQPTLKR